jgi:hypothetical protein
MLIGAAQLPAPAPVLPLGIALFTGVSAYLMLLKRRPALGWIVSMVALLESAHVAGRWVDSSAGLGTRVLAASIPVLTIGMMAGAAERLTSHPREAFRLAAMGAVTTMISVVTDSWSWFVRLETSSALGSTVGRSVVTAVLGISAAVFAWAASHIVRDIPFGPPPWRRATLDD